jgi:diguanylate cyclase (GGDEF)-like protein
MPENIAEQILKKGKEAMKTGKTVSLENERNERFFDTFFVPVPDPQEGDTFQIISKDITESKKMEKKLKEISLYDPLTKLYSRTFFEEEMVRLEKSRYYPMAIIVCDIDGLKIINDAMGHKQGDKLLKAAASILNSCFRTSDVVARIGGDEFSVLLPEANTDRVIDYCRRIRKEIKRYNKNKKAEDFSLSVSIGYSINYNPPTDMNILFKEADDTMYKEKLQKRYSSKNKIIQALIATMEARDYITDGHAERLEKYVRQLGASIGLSEKDLNDLSLLARFHDLGKVGVPDSILFKKEPLTEKEFEEMKRHCNIGQRIALSTSDMAHIADYILKHHEWWNGSGYPLHLKKEEIPLLCRILAIADAYDAMTENRPYRKALTHEEALKRIKMNAGTQFDPCLVKKFLEIMEKVH